MKRYFVNVQLDINTVHIGRATGHFVGSMEDVDVNDSESVKELIKEMKKIIKKYREDVTFSFIIEDFKDYFSSNKQSLGNFFKDFGEKDYKYVKFLEKNVSDTVSFCTDESLKNVLDDIKKRFNEIIGDKQEDIF